MIFKQNLYGVLFYFLRSKVDFFFFSFCKVVKKRVKLEEDYMKMSATKTAKDICLLLTSTCFTFISFMFLLYFSLPCGHNLIREEEWFYWNISMNMSLYIYKWEGLIYLDVKGLERFDISRC